MGSTSWSRRSSFGSWLPQPPAFDVGSRAVEAESSPAPRWSDVEVELLAVLAVGGWRSFCRALEAAAEVGHLRARVAGNASNKSMVVN